MVKKKKRAVWDAKLRFEIGRRRLSLAALEPLGVARAGSALAGTAGNSCLISCSASVCGLIGRRAVGRACETARQNGRWSLAGVLYAT